MNPLIQSLLPQLQDRLAPEIAKRLGIDEALVRQGISIAIPFLISALARNSSSPEGAQSLNDALARDHDGTALQSPDSLLGRYASGEGSAILSHIFGEQRPQVEQAITSGSGIDGSALLQILAPAVMGALGQAQRKGGLDASGLAGLLQNEQSQLARSDGGALEVATKLLDSDGDGSVTNEVIGMLGKLMGGKG